MTRVTALQFYKNIQANEDKYRLVNGLFIVRYIDENTGVYIGDFERAGSARNDGKTNVVSIPSNSGAQRFDKKRSMTTTSLGFWKTLRISFNEEPIKEILNEDKQKVAEEFQKMKDRAELKALSNYSLENPLTDKQYSKMMELKKELLK